VEATAPMECMIIMGGSGAMYIIGNFQMEWMIKRLTEGWWKSMELLSFKGLIVDFQVRACWRKRQVCQLWVLSWHCFGLFS
jgi:hypothetical protein